MRLQSTACRVLIWVATNLAIRLHSYAPPTRSNVMQRTRYLVATVRTYILQLHSEMERNWRATMTGGKQ